MIEVAETLDLSNRDQVIGTHVALASAATAADLYKVDDLIDLVSS